MRTVADHFVIWGTVGIFLSPPVDWFKICLDFDMDFGLLTIDALTKEREHIMEVANW